VITRKTVIGLPSVLRVGCVQDSVAAPVAAAANSRQLLSLEWLKREISAAAAIARGNGNTSRRADLAG